MLCQFLCQKQAQRYNHYENWFKDSILENIGVLDGDWDNHSSSRWKINLEQGWKTYDFL